MQRRSFGAHAASILGACFNRTRSTDEPRCATERRGSVAAPASTLVLLTLVLLMPQGTRGYARGWGYWARYGAANLLTGECRAVAGDCRNVMEGESVGCARRAGVRDKNIGGAKTGTGSEREHCTSRENFAQRAARTPSAVGATNSPPPAHLTPSRLTRAGAQAPAFRIPRILRFRS